MQRARTAKSCHVDSEHVAHFFPLSFYLLALLLILHSMLFSQLSSRRRRRRLARRIYVNEDHAHANEQERQNQILFEHDITITARTRICPHAHARTFA